MFKAFEFCLPTLAKSVPAGPEWFHEIKYDGYRVQLERRLITKGGYDRTRRYPRIIEAALKNRQKRFVIDGEAIIRGVDGYSDFNALHSGKYNVEVERLAFDTRPSTLGRCSSSSCRGPHLPWRWRRSTGCFRYSARYSESRWPAADDGQPARAGRCHGWSSRRTFLCSHSVQ